MAINSKGLEQDIAPINQSKDTTRFVLNGVNESLDGDLMNLSNENSNLLYTHIKEDFVVLGSLYIGDGETIIFSVKNDNSESEIGILKDNTSFEQTGRQDNYEVWCNDSCQNNSKKKLNFRTDKPIDSTYRIRRGCEKNVYFTDDWNEPRKANLQKPELYHDIERDNNNQIISKCWNSKKFKLINTYEKIPKIEEVEILENEGSLKSGSYSYMIQYLDEDFNPSPTVLEVNQINIFRDNLKQKYHKIEGSTSVDYKDIYSSTATSKAIKLTFDNLDKKYPFWRIIIINYNSGTGKFNGAFASKPISTEINSYIHSNNEYNGYTQMTVEELMFSDNATIVERAKHIGQIDNTLLLVNTQGQQANICNLQKYASQITVDCVIKKTRLTDITDKHNSKNPLINYNGLSFQPGEIYSLGIMYLFENLTTSPVYHIPGKGPGEDLAKRIYAPEEDGNVYPMKNEPDETSFGINANANITYTDRSFCDDNKYWGRDFEGKELNKNTKIRHHRFPTRKEVGTKLIELNDDVKNDDVKNSTSNNLYMKSNSQIFKYKNFKPKKDDKDLFFEDKVFIYYTFKFTGEKEQAKKVYLSDYNNDEIFVNTNKKIEYLKIQYGKDNETNGQNTKPDDKDVLYYSDKHDDIITLNNSGALVLDVQKENDVFKVKEIKVVNEKNKRIEIKEGTDGWTHLYKLHFFISNHNSVDNNLLYNSYIFGIKLSNVRVPSEEEIGKKVIGYYIMKQERTQQEKTILGTGIITPTVPNKRYRNVDWFAPQYKCVDCGDSFKKTYNETEKNKQLFNYIIARDCFGIISPDHLFTDKTFDSFSVIEEDGYYQVDKQIFSGYIQTDVFGKKVEGDFEYKDDDSMTLRNLTQFTKVSYQNKKTKRKPFKIIRDKHDVELFNLQPCTYGTHSKTQDYIYNISNNEKKLIIVSNVDDIDEKSKENGWLFYNHENQHLPYVYIKKDKNEFYKDFRSTPYYKINENYIPIKNKETKHIFGGDIHITPMRLNSQNYSGGINAKRVADYSFWKVVVGGILTLVAVVLTATGVLAPIGAALAWTGVGLMAVGTVALGYAESVRASTIQEMLNKHWKDKLDWTVQDMAYHVFIRNPIYYVKKGLLWSLNQGSVCYDTAGTCIGGCVCDSKDYHLYPKDHCWYADDSVTTRSQVLADVFFETQLNVNLLNLSNKDVLNPLLPFYSELEPKSNWFDKWSKHTGRNKVRYLSSSDGRDGLYLSDDELLAETPVDKYFFHKQFDLKDDKYKFQGFSRPSIYSINADYLLQHKIKSYFHLPIEYDCCSKCKENFTHRWFWSNQSFSEELTDNYRIFKPNNYKDLQGETGEITNMFVFQNNLYLQTEEALWLQPRNQQQQTIDQVVTFIGTGEYYSLPPQKIIDSKSGYSGGTLLKQSIHVTPYGILYVSEKDRKIYLFNGKLESISDKGLQKWFNKNILFEINKDFKKITKRQFPLIDNPQTKLGAGFISVFDKENERYIFTKRDFGFKDNFNPGEGFDIQSNGTQLVIFRDKNEIIANKARDGWKFIGYTDDGRMKFEKTELIEEEKEISHKEFVFKNIDYIVMYYDFGRTWQQSKDTEPQELNTYDAEDLDTMTIFTEPIPGGPFGFGCHNKGGSMKADTNPEDRLYSFCGDNTGPGLESVIVNVKKLREENTTGNNLLKWSMRAFWWGNETNNVNKGKVVIYCKVYKKGAGRKSHLNTAKHEFYVTENGQQIKEDGFFTFNPVYIDKRHTNACIANDDIPLLGNFEYDYEKIILKDANGNILNNFNDQKVTVTEKIKTSFEEKRYSYVKGEVIPMDNFYNTGWTISYSLKNKTWTAWHSYIPNHYIDMEKYFYSWLNGNSGIYKHNIPHKFQEFYGKRYPFIIEFVNNENPIQTKIFEYISFITQALKWNEDLESYVEKRFITFNKGMFYNSRQNSGILNLVVKDTNGVDEDYLWEQVKDYNGDTILLDRNEIDWTVNEMRDYRINYDVPLFIEDKEKKEIQDNYFIDKVVNKNSLDYNKPWETLEMLRDKYLVVRLIFDNFEDIKLVFNFSRETELPSPR